MATDAQITANRRNAQLSTGPRTAEGKGRVSRNAVSCGLFTVRDFVRPEEEDRYQEFCTAMVERLHPEDPLEQTLATEIVHAAWRLDRCSVAEASLSESPESAEGDSLLDPMLDPGAATAQAAIDRARNQAQRNLQRSISELRRLQTERRFQKEIFSEDADISELGLASYREVTSSIATDNRARLLQRKLDKIENLIDVVNAADRELLDRAKQAAGPTTTETQSAVSAPSYTPPPSPPPTPRSAPCPCRSGLKYKRCCGKNAPAVLSAAA